MPAAFDNSFERAYHWRRRNLMLRGLLSLSGSLLVLVIWAAGLLPMPAVSTLLWVALLALPSLLFWPTRRLPARHQSRWLMVELLLDILLFLALISYLGGAGNPVAFYLLVPLLIASLSIPLAPTLLLLLVAFAGYGLSLQLGTASAHQHPLHDLTHGISDTHGLGMWMMFGLLGGTISALGHALQQAQARHTRQTAVELNLGLQRERMYQIAADLADRAHEINTPLNALLLLTEDWTEQADATQQQVSQLVQRIATLLQPAAAPDVQQPLHLSQLCERTGQQLHLLAPQLQLVFHGPHDPLLEPAADWLRILNNLGYNACDAGASQCVIAADYRDNLLTIQISDDGPRHPARSGDQQQGLGLGLVLIESTLASLGGSLELLFDNRWTTAIIQLPVSTPPTEVKEI